MKPFRLIAAALLVLPFMAMSQDIYTLSGHVTDGEKQPLNSGDIFILKESDSSVLKKADILKGLFAFEPLIKGEYLLKITASGYKEKMQLLVLDDSKSIVITMEHSPQFMQAVTVTAGKRMLVSKDGNTLMNVENSPLAFTPDAITLLSQLPTVQVSPDGEAVSVVGKGAPLIYIDNQKVGMEDLKSLSVSDIKTIELINNPSAKYEANGKTVLLVTRKTNKKEGWKAELGETAAYRRYYLNRSVASLSVRKKKLELKGNFQYNQLKTWEGNAFEFQIRDRHIDSKYSVTAVTTRPQFVGEAGAFYQINDGDYISVSANARAQNESFPIYTNSLLKDASREESVSTSTYNKNPNLYYTSKLNYNKKIDNGSLFVGMQQTGFLKDRKTNIYNNYNNTSSVLSQNRVETSNIRVLAVRADIETTFAKQIKLEAGAAATHAASSGFSNVVSYQPVNSVHAIFDYDEKDYAAYAQMSTKLKKSTISGGLRAENTNVTSNFNDNLNPASIKKNTTQLFPKANLVVPVDSSKSITLKYAKTIERPDYSNANQTAVYINPFFEWSNNINLNPSVTEEAGATFQYNNYSLAMSVYRTRGAVYSNFIYNENDGILRRSELNYDKEYGTQLTLTIPFKYKIWSSTNVMTAMLRTVKDPQAVSSKVRPFVYYYSNNEFKLPRQFVFTLSGWAVTKQYSGAIERSALFAVDTSLTKTFFKNLNCSIRFTDMFRSLNNNGEKFSVNDVAANGVFSDNRREFAIALKYPIGVLKESRYQNRDIDEQGGRVK